MRTNFPKLAGMNLPLYRELLSEPTNCELLLRLARELLDADRIALAKDIFLRIVELGKLSTNELVTNKIAADMGARIFEKHPGLYENMLLSDKALELMRTDKYTDHYNAEEMMKDVVNKYSDSYLNWYNFGIIMSKPLSVGRHANLLMDPHILFPEYLNNKHIKRIESEYHWWIAIRCFFKALSLFPFDPDLLVDLGAGLSNVGLYDEGNFYINKASAFCPNHPRIEDTKMNIEKGLKLRAYSLEDVLFAPMVGLSTLLGIMREKELLVSKETGVKMVFHIVYYNRELAMDRAQNLQRITDAFKMFHPYYCDEIKEDANIIFWSIYDFLSKVGKFDNRRSICYLDYRIPHLDLIYEDYDNLYNICEILGDFYRVVRFGKFVEAS